jgi:16S rRNA (cytidine1402-2'-O)-methyltransferase
MTTAQAPVGRLLVCPTPIGNLDDVTLRVLAALREADAVACEDTRHTRVLLDRHGIRARLVSVHEHNERARAQELVERMQAGAVVALVSDAGTPLVSDPGFALVRAALAAELPLEVLPGPSAVVTALVASGLPVDRWRFVGFLPRSRRELETLLVDTAETLVAFESPRRLAATLGVLAARDPTRPVAVCRELTKLHEEVRRGTAVELAAHYGETSPRGEVVLVCGAAPAGRVRNEVALAALHDLVDAGAKARPAAAAVAKLTGLAPNELYRELTSGR